MSGKKPPPMTLHDVRHDDIPVARHDASLSVMKRNEVEKKHFPFPRSGVAAA